MSQSVDIRRVPRAFKAAFKQARREGWDVVFTKNGHIRWQPPYGCAVFTPSSPSDYRGERNAIAKLRRAGLDVKVG